MTTLFSIRIAAISVCTSAVILLSLMLSSGIAQISPITAEKQKGTSDHTMFGGTPSRNMVNLVDKGVPDRVDPDAPLWMAKLGGRSYGGPVIAHGKVFAGTDNEFPRNRRDIKLFGDPIERGILLCLEEKTGKFLWQAVHPTLSPRRLEQMPHKTLCSTPTVEGNRVYYLSNRWTVVCADIDGQKSKTPAGVERIKFNEPTDARFIWEYDFVKELKVHPHAMCDCSPMGNYSPLVVRDLVFVVTSNGVGEDHVKIPSPQAPSFIALDKNNGKLIWKSNAPGKDIMHGQWSNPVYAEINGLRQVIFPGGDGWLYSFVPESGELIWKFDCNPKDSFYELGGTGTRSDFIGTPVVYDNKVYIGTGQDPAHCSGIANFYCIAPTKKGDISRTTISGRDKKGKPFNEKPNPNSCEYWFYGGPENRRWAQQEFKFGRTMSTACIVDGIVYISDLSGFLHCLDARSGEHYWQYDTKANIFGSPYYVDGKILLGNEQGDLFVFRHLKEHKIYDVVKAAEHAKDKDEARKLRAEFQKQLAEKYLISKVEFDAPIRSSPVVANGVLYVLTETRLYAFQCGN
jgi:outer membrane protein assembly factor BamB